MAGFTTAAVLGTGLLSAGSGIAQNIGAGKREKETTKAIENFERQDLVNSFKNISINTLKSDQQTDANLSNTATSVDALQRGGTRAVLAGLPRLSESNILLQNIISQDLQDQATKRDLAIAEGDFKIQDIQERREENALLGLGQQLQTARQDKASGMNNVVSSGLALGSAFANSENSLFKSKAPKNTSSGVNFSKSTMDDAFKLTNPLFTQDFNFSDFNFSN